MYKPEAKIYWGLIFLKLYLMHKAVEQRFRDTQSSKATALISYIPPVILLIPAQLF